MSKLWQCHAFLKLVQHVGLWINSITSGRQTSKEFICFVSYLQQAPILKSVAYQFVQMHQTLMVADMVGEDRKHHCVLKNNGNKEKHSTSVYSTEHSVD